MVRQRITCQKDTYVATANVSLALRSRIGRPLTNSADSKVLEVCTARRYAGHSFLSVRNQQVQLGYLKS